MQKLHDEIMPDANNFAKELKAGHVKSGYEEQLRAAVKDKGKKRDDGNKKEEKGKGGNTGRGVEVAFGGDNWGFRQVLRVDTRRCCGGCGA